MRLSRVFSIFCASVTALVLYSSFMFIYGVWLEVMFYGSIDYPCVLSQIIMIVAFVIASAYIPFRLEFRRG